MARTAVSEKIDLYKLHKTEYVTPKEPVLIQVGAAKYLAAEGVGVLLAEQSVARALGVAGRIYALAQGRVVAQGPAAELRRSPVLERAFLGADIALSSQDPNSRPEAHQ